MTKKAARGLLVVWCLGSDQHSAEVLVGAGQALGAVCFHVLDLLTAVETGEVALVCIGVEKVAFTQFSIPPSSEKELTTVGLIEDLLHEGVDIVVVMSTAHPHRPHGDAGVGDGHLARRSIGFGVDTPAVKELVAGIAALVFVANLHPAIHARGLVGHRQWMADVAAGPAVHGTFKKERLNFLLVTLVDDHGLLLVGERGNYATAVEICK